MLFEHGIYCVLVDLCGGRKMEVGFMLNIEIEVYLDDIVNFLRYKI